MTERSMVLGLDVHKELITVAVADRAGGEPRARGAIPHDSAAVAKLVRKFGPPARLAACYEAGPFGYGLYRQLTGLGVDCTVVAPSLVPTAPGDRVKTDRRDALKLARLHRSGELTAVWVPDEAHEAFRDLTRARDDARLDLHRSRQRLSNFLWVHDLRPPQGVKAWSHKHRRWLDALGLSQPSLPVVLSEGLHTIDLAVDRVARLDAAIKHQAEQGPLAPLLGALQTLRGVGPVTAAMLVAELGDLSRFPHPRDLMAYAGLVPREHSSGSRQRRSGITKTGNAQVRYGVIEACWHYLAPPP